jgi:hypothetical protein
MRSLLALLAVVVVLPATACASPVDPMAGHGCGAAARGALNALKCPSIRILKPEATITGTRDLARKHRGDRDGPVTSM